MILYIRQISFVSFEKDETKYFQCYTHIDNL